MLVHPAACRFPEEIMVDLLPELRLEICVGEGEHAVDEIGKIGEQLIVDPLLEVMEIQVDVLHPAAEVCRVIEAQRLRMELLQERSCGHERSPALGHLLPVDREEAV